MQDCDAYFKIVAFTDKKYFPGSILTNPTQFNYLFGTIFDFRKYLSNPYAKYGMKFTSVRRGFVINRGSFVNFSFRTSTSRPSGHGTRSSTPLKPLLHLRRKSIRYKVLYVFIIYTIRYPSYSLTVTNNRRITSHETSRYRSLWIMIT